MSASSQQSCISLITTSIALCDQFQKSLQEPHPKSSKPSDAPDARAPLHLLKAATELLKSTTTRLSLLTITPPFTGTAIASLLQPLNDSILPSLVAATLLVTDYSYPESFATETKRLTKFVLLEIRALLDLVNQRAQDGKPSAEVAVPLKQSITEATGRVWENCDGMIQFADGDVPGYVLRRADQWLALMKDAVKELQDWDPEEDVDEDVFGIEAAAEDAVKENGKGQDEAVIAAGVKDQVLKVLSRIPQSIHVVVKQRLAKLPTGNDTQMTLKQREALEKMVKKMRQISECIDESAESMYLGNPELCLKKAGEARALTIEVVESVIQPWNTSSSDTKETKEDTYIKRALVWIQQVEPGTSKTP